MAVVMESASKKNRQAILSFIESYRELPELWDVGSAVYSNRVKKAEAYDVLIDRLRVLEPDASRESVVKKINNLRSSFRKELKKVNESKRSGDPADLYVPSLWYFKELMFLVDHENSDRTVSNIDGQSNEANDNDTNEYMINDTKNNFSDGNFLMTSDETYSAAPSVKKKRKSTNESVAEDLLSVVKTYLSNDDDEFMILAKGYASKLKKMTPLQRMFADRVINEALLEGQMGNLTRWSSITIDLPSSSIKSYSDV